MVWVQFEETGEHFKATIAVRRNWVLLILFTVCLIVWVGMLGTIVAAMFREGFGWLLNAMLLVWLVLWYFVGKVLWKQWKFYMAKSEIMLFEKDRLIIWRPVWLFGLTDGYDMAHVQPFYYHAPNKSISFHYGSRRIDFAYRLPVAEVERLVGVLNGRYFPHHAED